VDLVTRAHQFARRAYGQEEDLAHPLEVSRLVEATGAPDELTAAALLHDVLEDTDLEASELASAFGSHITALVCTLTEDETIANYQARKADLRSRAAAAGHDAALISVADKLSNTRRMRRGEKAIKQRKVAHYEATLALMRAEFPSLPLLEQLAQELAGLRQGQPITAG
jgi:(p)ppGpp synthase/HD superfamily hydrolase